MFIVLFLALAGCGASRDEASSASESSQPAPVGTCTADASRQVTCRFSGVIDDDATLFVGGPGGTPVDYSINDAGDVVFDLPSEIASGDLDVCVMAGGGVCRSIGRVTVESVEAEPVPAEVEESDGIPVLSCQQTGCIGGEVCGGDGVCHPVETDIPTPPPVEMEPSEPPVSPGTRTCRELGCPAGQECGAEGTCQEVIEPDEEDDSSEDGGGVVPPVEPEPEADDEVIEAASLEAHFVGSQAVRSPAAPGLVRIGWSIEGEELQEAYIYFTVPKNRFKGAACRHLEGLFADENGAVLHVADEGPVSSAALMRGRSLATRSHPVDSNDVDFLAGARCDAAKGNCHGFSGDASADTITCKVSLMRRAEGVFYHLLTSKKTTYVLAARSRMGGWKTDRYEAEFASVGIEDVSFHISSEQPKLFVSMDRSHARMVVLGGCALEAGQPDNERIDGIFASDSGRTTFLCDLKTRRLRLTATGEADTLEKTFVLAVGSPKISRLEKMTMTCHPDAPVPTEADCPGNLKLRWTIEREGGVSVRETSGDTDIPMPLGNASRQWFKSVKFMAKTNATGAWADVDACPRVSVADCTVLRDHEHTHWKLVVEDADGSRAEQSVDYPYVARLEFSEPSITGRNGEFVLSARDEGLEYQCHYDSPEDVCDKCWNGSDASTTHCALEGSCSNHWTFIPRKYAWTVQARHCRSLTSTNAASKFADEHDPASYELSTRVLEGSQHRDRDGNYQMTCATYEGEEIVVPYGYGHCEEIYSHYGPNHLLRALQVGGVIVGVIAGGATAIPMLVP